LVKVIDGERASGTAPAEPGIHNCQHVRHKITQPTRTIPAKTPALTDFRRIVIKVGSRSSSISAAGRVHEVGSPRSPRTSRSS
jgi:hypothetical protein